MKTVMVESINCLHPPMVDGTEMSPVFVTCWTGLGWAGLAGFGFEVGRLHMWRYEMR